MSAPITASYNAETRQLAVTYRGETREFPVNYDGGRYVVAYNVFSGKFKTGAKLWPLAVYFWHENSAANVQQGGFSNKGGATGLVGWWNPGSAANSQYKGKR